MKILFIYKIESFVAPLGPMVISAAAKEAGHETFLCEHAQRESPRADCGYPSDIVPTSLRRGGPSTTSASTRR
jgi:hypothetical protein